MTPDNSTPQTCTNEDIESGKNTAIIAYIAIIGLIIALIINNDKKNPFASYHIRQVVGLAVSGLAIGAVGMIPVLGWLVSILGFVLIVVLWVMGLINALNGKTKSLPILGEKFEEWFKNIG